MNVRDITLYVLKGAIIIVVFFTSLEVRGQNISQKEFRAAASAIALHTDNTYNLVRMGSNKTPAILSVNRSANVRTLPESQRNDRSAVRNFAQSESQYIAANALGLPKNSLLVEIGTALSGNLWLSSFALSYNGIPLRERFLRMNIGALSGEVMVIRNNIPVKEPNVLSPAISDQSILEQTTTLLGIHADIKSQPKLVFIDQNENVLSRLCYEVVASDPDMNEMWRLTFDATSGELIEKKSLLEHEDFSLGAHSVCPLSEFREDQERARAVCPYDQTTIIREKIQSGASGRVLANVHLHTPFDTLTTVGLPYEKLKVNGTYIETDSNGYWTLTSANYPLAIETSFDSRFMTVYRQDKKLNSTLKRTIQSGSADLLWDDSNSDASERDAFYSASYARLADKRVDEGLKNIDLHMKVNVNINASCNAFYTPADTAINFFNASANCSNTAQIADVIFHEYGHRVTNVRYQQAAGTDWNIVDGSLSEGFADLNSAFIRDDPRIGKGFFGNNEKILRNCDNTKKWPGDISPDIHISGEIISGAFWDLRKTIGKEAAEHLFNFMEYQMPDGIDVTDSASLEQAFANTLLATIITDDDDNNLVNGTPHLNQILSAFKLHNITLSDFISLNLLAVKDQDTSAKSYHVWVQASYNGLIGALDWKTMKIIYTIDNGKSYKWVGEFFKGNNKYMGLIPRLPAGSIIKYYATAATTLGDTVSNPSPLSPYMFVVGFNRTFKDDAEQDRGWSLKSPTDTATTGLWVREKPNGTFNDPTPPITYIQQDTDHSEFGTMCYVTGNHIDPSGNNNPGYDDVDGGAVTLTTPAYDLSNLKSPFIRYWYYYSNDKGANAGIPKWQVDVSNDNGATWKSLQQTDQSTLGWTQFSFSVNDYITPSSSVTIRFIASDYIGALVEAGVDDLEILDPIQTESAVPTASPIPLQFPYPNPAHRAEKLHLTSNGNSSVQLTDLLGRILASSDMNNGSFVMPVNITPGIYFIKQAGLRFKIVVAE